MSKPEWDVNTLNKNVLNSIKQNCRRNLDHIRETKKNIFEAGTFLVTNGEIFEMAGWGTIDRFIDKENKKLVATFGIIDHKNNAFSGVLKGNIIDIKENLAHSYSLISALVECVVLKKNLEIRHFKDVLVVMNENNESGYGVLYLEQKKIIPSNPEIESDLIKSIVETVVSSK